MQVACSNSAATCTAGFLLEVAQCSTRSRNIQPHGISCIRRTKPLSTVTYRFQGKNSPVAGAVPFRKCVHLAAGRRASERDVTARASGGNSETVVSTAADAVNKGLALFKAGKVKEALSQFDAALQMQPAPEEAQAALYNKACCHASRGEGQQAQAALREALGKHELAFAVILQDPDLAAFRAMPEFKALQDEARKGGADIGDNFRRDMKLISEVQSPFRGVRKFLYVGLTAAAGISTIITVPRLIVALRGGEGAPDLAATAGNLAINVAGAAVFVALFLWDQRKEEEQIVRVARNETLSRLPLRVGSDRVLALSQLRETTRPVIVAGKKEAVERCVKAYARYRDQLLERGVLLVPLVWSSSSGGDALAEKPKKGFGGAAAAKTLVAAAPVVGDADDFEAKAKAVAMKKISAVDRRAKAEPVSPGEWELWIKEQQEAEGVTPGDDVYLVLRLDGRLRKSGRGMPDWAELVEELPPLDALVSKLER